MTKKTIKELEDFFKQSINDIEELEIPTYIRNEEEERDEFTDEYPLGGGVIEPYDIEREKEL